MALAALATVPLEHNLQASLANTGVDVNSGGQDLNWTVSSPYYTGPAAYLAAPANAWPFSTGGGPWVADDNTSSWITYSTPLDMNAPATTYTYRETFTLASAETLAFRFLSDNESTVFLLQGAQQTQIGQNGPAYDTSTFSMWSPYQTLNLGSGTYGFEVQVVNDPWSGANPTGFRFEEYQVVSPVPEPTSIVAGALMLIPLGLGFLRAIRKDGAALKLN